MMPFEIIERQLVRPLVVSTFLNISTRELLRLVEDEVLPAIWLGNDLRFDLDAIKAFVAAGGCRRTVRKVQK